MLLFPISFQFQIYHAAPCLLPLIGPAKGGSPAVQIPGVMQGTPTTLGGSANLCVVSLGVRVHEENWFVKGPPKVH